jgi:hypothetical protein
MYAGYDSNERHTRLAILSVRSCGLIVTCPKSSGAITLSPRVALTSERRQRQRLRFERDRRNTVVTNEVLPSS